MRINVPLPIEDLEELKRRTKNKNMIVMQQYGVRLGKSKH